MSYAPKKTSIKIIDKQSVIILSVILVWVSYLVADGTTHHDGFLLLLLNSAAIFLFTVLAIIAWAVLPFVLYLLGFLPEDAPSWRLVLANVIGAIIALKTAEYFYQVYQHIQQINLEIFYG